MIEKKVYFLPILLFMHFLLFSMEENTLDFSVVDPSTYVMKVRKELDILKRKLKSKKYTQEDLFGDVYTMDCTRASNSIKSLQSILNSYASSSKGLTAPIIRNQLVTLVLTQSEYYPRSFMYDLKKCFNLPVTDHNALKLL